MCKSEAPQTMKAMIEQGEKMEARERRRINRFTFHFGKAGGAKGRPFRAGLLGWTLWARRLPPNCLFGFSQIFSGGICSSSPVDPDAPDPSQSEGDLHELCRKMTL